MKEQSFQPFLYFKWTLWLLTQISENVCIVNLKKKKTQISEQTQIIQPKSLVGILFETTNLQDDAEVRQCL